MESTYKDFRKIDIRIGTVLSVNKNEKAHQPALVLEIDFGKEIGIKTTSAKITHFYNSNNLIGLQIIAVCNLPIKNIAGINSEVLILGAVDIHEKVVLIHPTKQVTNGIRVY